MNAKGRNIGTRISAMLLVLACGLGVRAYGFAGGTGEPNNPYQIATVADLLSINMTVDASLVRKCYVLSNDLDLDPNLPPGRVFTGPVISSFSGVFDGRGHVIRHLCINATKSGSVGLFSSVHGVVKDLHLEEVQINGSSSCGALAAFAAESTILHCSVTGKVTGADETGGLIGNAWDSTVLQCESQADVSGKTMVGGLAGHAIPGAYLGDCRASGTVVGTHAVGGLLGDGSGVLIADGATDSRVTGADQVGGLVGSVSFLSTMMRCAARADVSGTTQVGGLVGGLNDSQTAQCRAAGSVTGTDSVGGLAGSSTMAAIRGCAALCDVTAKAAAGGLVGDFQANVSLVDSYARGSVAGSMVGGLLGNTSLGVFGNCIVNSYAACAMLALPADEKAPVAGGLFGQAAPPSEAMPPGSAAKVVACYWDTDVSKVLHAAGSGSAGYSVGLTTPQMQQADTFRQAGWDFDHTWALPEKGGYPVLQWELR